MNEIQTIGLLRCFFICAATSLLPLPLLPETDCPDGNDPIDSSLLGYSDRYQIEQSGWRS